MLTGDPYADFVRRDAEESKFRKRLPVCVDCGEPIMGEHFYNFDGRYICAECLDENYMRWTDDYLADH